MSDQLDIDAWESLLRAHASIVTVLEDEVEAATGLQLREYDVLLELNRAGADGLRMSELGGRVVLSRSRVSRLVDDMVDGGLVEKVDDPADGRATLARMTPKGRNAFRRAAPVYLNGIRRHFSRSVSMSELDTLRRVFQRLVADQ